MPSIQGKALIVEKEMLKSDICKLVLKNDFISELSKAGQFLHILCGEKLLRRPISICRIDKVAHTLTIVFQIKGEGTHWMADQAVGTFLDVIGPLGNGFDLDTDKKVLVIGGGIGVPPMLGIADELGKNCDAILGFKSIENTILLEQFSDVCKETTIMTDDGSLGSKGFVTNAMTRQVKLYDYDVIYACGPTPMLKGISEIAIQNNIECFVSLEERMGCGIGACLTCACKIMRDGETKMLRVCKDGPVFNAKEVVW